AEFWPMPQVSREVREFKEVAHDRPDGQVREALLKPVSRVFECRVRDIDRGVANLTGKLAQDELRLGARPGAEFHQHPMRGQAIRYSVGVILQKIQLDPREIVLGKLRYLLEERAALSVVEIAAGQKLLRT